MLGPGSVADGVGARPAFGGGAAGGRPAEGRHNGSEGRARVENFPRTPPRPRGEIFASRARKLLWRALWSRGGRRVGEVAGRARGGGAGRCWRAEGKIFAIFARARARA